jgi:HSP20 family protein
MNAYPMLGIEEQVMPGFADESSAQKMEYTEQSPGKPRRRWRPPTDVYETERQVVVKVEIAGMKTDDFTISFADRVLVISGQRYDPVGKVSYQNMEIPYGEFRTEVRIGWPLEQREIEATYENGFLFVRLPKHSREHRIPVRSNTSS